jgi:phenylalanine-4-hydroxylase
LEIIFNTIKANHFNDWLLALEIFELTLDETVLKYLMDLKVRKPKVAHLIDDGLLLIEKQNTLINKIS